ncbi:hypothetical protein llg_26240 [Luteolibacter sp. LG18]|nr:hypothetical protein llg_26240 [Luteolibacter sp. LG18]
MDGVRGKEIVPTNEGMGRAHGSGRTLFSPVAPAVRPYLSGVPLEVGSSRRDDRAVDGVRGKEIVPTNEGMGQAHGSGRTLFSPVAPAVRPYLRSAPLEVGSSRRDDRAVDGVRGKEIVPTNEGMGRAHGSGRTLFSPVAPAVRPYLGDPHGVVLENR